MKILIVGFQRSGTTLTKELFNAHPEVKRIFHETQLLKYPSKELLRKKIIKDATVIDNTITQRYKYNVDFNLRKDTWGEKIPYYADDIRGIKIRPIDYCQRWIDYFQNKARIINVVRHPYDVVLSTRNAGRKRIELNATKNKKLVSEKEIIAQYTSMTLRLVHGLNSMPHTMSFKYEYLLEHPYIVLTDLFDFCNLNSDTGVIEEVLNKVKIQKSRAFNHINQDTSSFLQIPKVLKRLDRLLAGPSYENIQH